MGSDLRRCNRCGVDRAAADFYIRKNGTVNPWCKHCYKSWYAERSGGVVSRCCDWCSETMQVTNRRASESSVYCSRRCKDLAQSRARQDAIDALKPERRCAWCGVEIPRTMRVDAKFCSAECNSLAHRRTRNYRRRMGPDAPERPRKEPLVRFIDIAERDGWRCRLCGGRVDRVRHHPDPLCASLDHIVPVATGGTNDPTNLQLAHLRCNLSKGSGSRGEQMLLL